MGLDIAFNREAAIKAGLVIKQERNGSEASIAAAKADPHEDTDYVAYLERVENVVDVPGTALRVADGGDAEDIIVRANRWGSVYEPLTDWLATNKILWTEF